MAKLEGIIYKTFNHYVVLRGFAPIKDLAAISHKPDSYQRNALDNHKKEIVEFLAMENTSISLKLLLLAEYMIMRTLQEISVLIMR